MVPTPEVPGGFVQMLTKTSSNPPGCNNKDQCSVNVQMYEFYEQKSAICYVCISLQLAPLDQIGILYMSFSLYLKVLRAAMQTLTTGLPVMMYFTLSN